MIARLMVRAQTLKKDCDHPLLRSYDFIKKAERFRDLFDPEQQKGMLHPEEHEVENGANGWGALGAAGWPGDPHAVIEGVMGLEY
jgi:hypothetical protein